MFLVWVSKRAHSFHFFYIPSFVRQSVLPKNTGLPRECALFNCPAKISVLLNLVCVGILKWSLSLKALFPFTHACLVFRCGVTPLPRSSTLLGSGLEACWPWPATTSSRTTATGRPAKPWCVFCTQFIVISLRICARVREHSADRASLEWNLGLLSLLSVCTFTYNVVILCSRKANFWGYGKLT